jgi:hypothetical protein
MTTSRKEPSLTNLSDLPFPDQEHNGHNPSDSTPVPVESRGSSTTTNPPSFWPGIIRKKFNSATIKQLEKHNKKVQEVVRSEEKPDVTMSTGTREEHNIDAMMYAEEILVENDRYRPLSHRIGEKPETTTAKHEEPEDEMKDENTSNVLNSETPICVLGAFAKLPMCVHGSSAT